MILTGAAALIALAFAPAEPPPAAPDSGFGLVITQQIIVRIRSELRLTRPGAAQVEWHEGGRGPRCIQANRIIGAAMLGQESVDLVMRDATRVRARLGRRCPALDYYYGFYINPGADGRICADRDAIRSRVGGECRIDRFRTLEAARR